MTGLTMECRVCFLLFSFVKLIRGLREVSGLACWVSLTGVTVVVVVLVVVVLVV